MANCACFPAGCLNVFCTCLIILFLLLFLLSVWARTSWGSHLLFSITNVAALHFLVLWLTSMCLHGYACTARTQAKLLGMQRQHCSISGLSFSSSTPTVSFHSLRRACQYPPAKKNQHCPPGRNPLWFKTFYYSLGPRRQMYKALGDVPCDW